MEKRKPHIGDSKTGNGWMLIFADLLSLMLTFFVLLFSMNSVQMSNWEAVVKTMTRQFNPENIAISETPHDTASDQAFSAQVLNLRYLESLMQQGLASVEGLEGLTLSHRGDRLILSVPAEIIFEDKSATIKQETETALKELAGILARVNNRIYISGHTNRAPIDNGQYLSNWELSMSRSRVIAGMISSGGYMGPMTVLAYADSRFSELSDSLDLSERYQLAERTDIVIANKGYKKDLYDIF
ncbi:hypothetical protein GCM10017044_25720 [Kordiimonas sediminis]|uniref:OmpA-like domain-containing protein n=1 Tax=Kordiimonas sediminis TaxID=1735581 RepID=A0A919EA57_9PROT|nr:flagellar motor protein MotB [Kordiimonas sediminis]GHF29324.1 hypothetical protein GCM10017044_25720 [Kordiimonas sediminis]